MGASLLALAKSMYYLKRINPAKVLTKATHCKVISDYR